MEVGPGRLLVVALNGAIRTGGGTVELDPGSAAAETDPYPAGGCLGGNFYNAGSYLVGEATSPITPAAIPFAVFDRVYNGHGNWPFNTAYAPPPGSRPT